MNEIDCWTAECNYSGGSCSTLCGDNGYCCSQDPINNNLNGDCPNEAISAIKNMTERTGHICVRQVQQDETCLEITTSNAILPFTTTQTTADYSIEYQLVAENSQCPGQMYINGKNDLVSLQECFQRALEPDSGCAENIVEWGNSQEFEAESNGYCLCYPEICTPDLRFYDGREHIVRFSDPAYEKIPLYHLELNSELILGT